MYNEKHIEELESIQDKVKELLRDSESVSFYKTWADTFEIEEITDKSIVIGYYGKAPLKKFKKECYEILWSNICLVVGYRENIKILEGKKRKASVKPQRKRFEEETFEESKPKKSSIKNTNLKNNIKAVKLLCLGLVFTCIAAAIGVVMFNYISNRNFRETFYNVSSLKVDSRIRVVQLSDLHNCRYGENNEKLSKRIEELHPDIIICTGDIIEPSKPDTSDIEQLGKALSKIAPLYYIYGNNEVESIYDIPLNEKELDEKFGFTAETRDETKLLELPDSLQEKLEESGFNVLKNEKDTIKVGTNNVDIYGVLTSNPSSFWTYTEKSFANYIYEDTDNLKITAIHEPFIFEEFNPEFWGDLMVCGHTHGGEIRVPVLGPLYTHEGGLFPARKGYFVYGRYDVAGRPLIVSSGLDNSNILRINNQPELVIIDINKF